MPAAAALALSAALSQAVARHRAGDLGVASLYRRTLVEDPAFADALHLFGLTLLQGGEADGARRWLGRAIAVNASQAIYRNSLGEALRVSEQPAAAVAQFRIAAMLDPAYSDAHANLLKTDGNAVGTARTAWLRYCRARAPGLAELQPWPKGC
jgi:Flp pilus assembly protein TadD